MVSVTTCFKASFHFTTILEGFCFPFFPCSIQELREERHALKVARGETVIPEEETLIPPSLRGGPDSNDTGWGGHPRGGGFNYAGK